MIYGIFYALATGVFLAITGAAVKFLSLSISTSVIIVVQYSTALVILLPRVLMKPKSRLKTQCFRLHLIRSLSGVICYYSYFLALKYIPLVDATLLRNSAPLFVPLVVMLWLQIQVPNHRWIPLAIGFCGIVFIIKPGFHSLNLWYLIGISAAFGLAISMVSTRKLSHTEPPIRAIFYNNIIGLGVCLPLLIVDWKPVPLNQWPWLISLGIGFYLMTYCYTKAYSFAPASVISPFSYFSILSTGLIGWMFWDHIPDALAMFGIIMVLFSGILAFILEGKKATKL